MSALKTLAHRSKGDMIPVASIVPAPIFGFAYGRGLFAFLILLMVGACAQLDRLPAVAVADTDRAGVAGISEARFLSNDTAAMAAFGRHLHERESRYYSSLGRPIPPESLLAISGGGDNGAFGAGVLVGWSESGARPAFKIVTGPPCLAYRSVPFSAFSPIVRLRVTPSRSVACVACPICGSITGRCAGKARP